MKENGIHIFNQKTQNSKHGQAKDLVISVKRAEEILANALKKQAEAYEKRIAELMLKIPEESDTDTGNDTSDKAPD